jgi:alpha-L-fucosidase
MLNRRAFLQNTTFSAAGLLLSSSWLNGLHATSPFAGNANNSLRFRQVHLDFHTSELIKDVAKNFDPVQFATQLKKASVNSVTCFARCHHGYLYYNSAAHSERIHPHLTNRNLLKEQIEACHKLDIRVPVYTTIQWDHYTAKQRPEWLVRDEAGAPIGSGNTSVFKAGFYNHLDIATPYIDFLKAHLTDLFNSVPVDGLFLDIHHILPNANQTAIDGMLKKGIDPTKVENRIAYNKEVMLDYKADLTAFIRKLDKNCTIFYNSGHIGRTSVIRYPTTLT